MKRRHRELDIPRDATPVRAAPWEEKDGFIHVKMQKFEGRLGKWLCRMLHKPNHALVRLDELGSFIWKRCTGEATVDDILTALDTEMGGQFETEEEMEKRTFYFFYMLQNRGLITWKKEGGDTGS